MIENRTKGTAISFKRLIKIVPKGAIQLIVNSLNPTEEDTSAQTTPKIKPIIIFQCSANFFIGSSSFLNENPTSELNM
jgi:hypothetical protein